MPEGIVQREGEEMARAARRQGGSQSRKGHSKGARSAQLESLWKQNLYKTMPWVIFVAKIRTDLLDNRSLAILLETYKLLIC